MRHERYSCFSVVAWRWMKGSAVLECDVRNPSLVTFVPPCPLPYSTVIGWQSDREDGGQISATVDAIDKEVDISAVYQGLPYTCRAALKSVVSFSLLLCAAAAATGCCLVFMCDATTQPTLPLPHLVML